MAKITLKGWKAALARAGIGLAAAGTIAYLSYAINKINNDPPGCHAEIKPKHTREQIEGIVKDVKSPAEAVATLYKGMGFSKDADTAAGCNSGGRFMSMQESYALGKGNCMEGAIAFAALLSDNPEYEAKAVWLKPGHAIAVYRDKGKWGYVSFNDSINGTQSILFLEAKHAEMEDAIAGFCKGENTLSKQFLRLMRNS